MPGRVMSSSCGRASVDWFSNPENTYFVLLCVQAAHLLHHRLAKRHISFAEVLSALVLCIRPQAVPALAPFLPWVHLGLVAVQIVGSAFIKRLSPDWGR